MNVIQKDLLGMLVDFDEAMTKAGVHYYLAYGTALGAVRHKGFIPWDDDIDVFILRRDVAAFEKVVEDMPAKYILQKPFTLDWPDGFYKIKLDGSRAIEKTYPGSRLNHGLWIDVFVLDCYPDSGFRRLLHRIFGGIAHVSDIMTGKCIGKRILDPVQKALVLNIRCMHRLMDLIQDKEDCELYINRCVGWDVTRASVFDECTRMPFEGHMFETPGDWDRMLSDYFGDYMTPPPEAERPVHIIEYTPRREDA